MDDDQNLEGNNQEGNGETLSDEEILKKHKAGDFLTKERNEEIVRERIARAKEQHDKEAADAKASAEAEATRKALAENDQFKELSESQAADLASKDVDIERLKAYETRATDLEARLEKIVGKRLEALPKPYQELVEKMAVEDRADWLETNAELLKPTEEPAGSPPSPAGIRRNGKAATEEDKRARELQRRSPGSSI
jgi:hypothetical protein